MLEITDAAGEVLHRAHKAAVRFNPEAKIRISRRGGEVETGFADTPSENDATQEFEGLTLFVDPDIGAGILDVTEQHDRLVVIERFAD